MKKEKIIRISEKHKDMLKEYSKSEGRSMKYVIETYIETLSKEKKYGIRLKADTKER